MLLLSSVLHAQTRDYYAEAEEKYYSSDYPGAIKTALEGISQPGLKESDEADLNSILGASYSRLGAFDKAAQYMIRCYEYDKSQGETKGLTSSLINLASMYVYAGKAELAEGYALGRDSTALGYADMAVAIADKDLDEIAQAIRRSRCNSRHRHKNQAERTQAQGQQRPEGLPLQGYFARYTFACSGATPRDADAPKQCLQDDAGAAFGSIGGNHIAVGSLVLGAEVGCSRRNRRRIAGEIYGKPVHIAGLENHGVAEGDGPGELVSCFICGRNSPLGARRLGFYRRHQIAHQGFVRRHIDTRRRSFACRRGTEKHFLKIL